MAEPLQKWEYRRMYDPSDDDMDEAGADGWEACSSHCYVREDRDGFSDLTTIVFFKRKVSGDEAVTP